MPLPGKSDYRTLRHLSGLRVNRELRLEYWSTEMLCPEFWGSDSARFSYSSFHA
jgi:hypothetical protein